MTYQNVMAYNSIIARWKEVQKITMGNVEKNYNKIGRFSFYLTVHDKELQAQFSSQFLTFLHVIL